MKIVEINMLHMGSTGRIMFGIAECARRHGHVVWTFSPRQYQHRKKLDTPPIADHQYFGFAEENLLHLLLAKITGFYGMFSWFGTCQLLRELDRIQPDLIHLHNLHNWTIHLPMLFSYIKRKNIQTVWTLHDCWAFTGRCPYFTVADCEKWRSGCHHCPQRKQYPKTYCDRTQTMWKLKNHWFSGVEKLTLVTPSEWLANLVSQSFLSDYDIRTIHNGVRLDVFAMKEPLPAANAQKASYTVLGVAFDWDSRKGLDVFLQLRHMLPAEYQIVLVGTNAEIDKLLPQNIISIHRTNNQQELAELYRNADVFVNPTREDNFPTVNIEALACGTPVITFASCGSPEILDASCGSVVPCDDVDAMQREIIRVCTKRVYCAEACRSRAELFDMHSKYQEYVDLFAEKQGRT